VTDWRFGRLSNVAYSAPASAAEADEAVASAPMCAPATATVRSMPRFPVLSGMMTFP
jgi:hypothetical protein